MQAAIGFKHEMTQGPGLGSQVAWCKAMHRRAQVETLHGVVVPWQSAAVQRCGLRWPAAVVNHWQMRVIAQPITMDEIRWIALTWILIHLTLFISFTCEFCPLLHSCRVVLWGAMGLSVSGDRDLDQAWRGGPGSAAVSPQILKLLMIQIHDIHLSILHSLKSFWVKPLSTKCRFKVADFMTGNGHMKGVQLPRQVWIQAEIVTSNEKEIIVTSTEKSAEFQKFSKSQI